MRLVTGTIPGVKDRKENPLINEYRRADQFAFGEKVAARLTLLFGEHSALAATTCRIQIMGRNAHNHNGHSDRCGNWRPARQNRWVHTRLQTFGKTASHFRCSGSDWIYSDRWAGADEILGCFDLTLNEVLEAFDNVKDRERKILDLDTIIKRMRPELLR